METSEQSDSKKNVTKIKAIAQQIAHRKEEIYEILISNLIDHEPFPQKILSVDQFRLLRKLSISMHYVPLLKYALESKLLDANTELTVNSGIFRLINEAAFHQAYENLELLLEFGADPNQTACNFEEHFSWQESPLFTSVDKRDNRMLQILLNDKRADPNKMYAHSNPLPLMRAVGNFCPDDPEDVKDTHKIISTLLQFGANPNARETMSSRACKYEDDHELWFNAKECFTPRELATEFNYTDIVTLFDSVKQTLI